MNWNWLGAHDNCFTYITKFQKKPESRQAQKKLAEEVTKLVHGGERKKLSELLED